MARIRVLIADDHAILRAGLRMLIGVQADIKVVGEAGDGAETLARARELTPDVVLLDLSMPGSAGTATIEQLVRLEPGPRVLVLTMHDDPAYMGAALRAGAAGYVVKQAADVELLTAIRVVHQGGTFVNLTRPGEGPGSHELRSAPRMAPATRQARPLSQREVAVLRLLAEGHTNQEAADQLRISVKTVETHRQRLRDKLGLKTRAHLVRFALECGLLGSGTARSAGS
jgi:two-component system, NarL family, response regulator NreC